MKIEYNKVSFFSIIINFCMKLLYYKRSTKTIEASIKLVNKVKDKKFINRYKLNNENSIDNIMKVYSYNGTIDNCNNGYLLYIHGGTFLENANRFQIRFAKKIADKANMTLIVCDYPLIPYGNSIKMFELFEKMYNILLDKNKDICFLGDSAGGGFAIAFSKYLKDKNIKTPRKILTLSPWLDISLSDEEIYELDKLDNMCGVDGSRYLGKLWAYPIDVKAPMVSPYYADVKDIGEITFAIGGYDMLRKQCLEFHERLNKENIEHNYIYFKNQGHIFGVLPIKESKILIDYFVKILER